METMRVSVVGAAHRPYHLPEPTPFLVRPTLLTR